MAVLRLIIEMQPFRLEIDELGSIKEASELLANEDTELARQFDTSFLSGTNPVKSGDAVEISTETPAADAPKPRRRKGQDPATASAPAPIAVPSAAPAAPTPPTPPVASAPELAAQVATAAENGTIPAFLNRAETPAPAAPAAAAPPPPLMPSAPPVAPAAPTPPTGVLAPKVIAELQRRAVDAGSKRALADWLGQCGITVPGANYDEAMAVLPFVADDKLTNVAAGLNIS